MDFYSNYKARYIAANPAERKAAREHWTRCHQENMMTGREDLIMFSAQMLAQIAVVDAERASE